MTSNVFTKIGLSLSALAFAFSSTVSSADILLEPYLSYHFGKIEYSGGGDDSLTGPLIGGRLGISHFGFQLGADFMSGKLKQDSKPSQDYTPSNLGVFVGYSFPILLRAYGTYFFDSELKDDWKYEGNAYRLGVGFSPLPLVDINIEYMVGTYDKINGVSLNGDTKTSTIGLGVSVPFEL